MNEIHPNRSGNRGRNAKDTTLASRGAGARRDDMPRIGSFRVPDATAQEWQDIITYLYPRDEYPNDVDVFKQIVHVVASRISEARRAEIDAERARREARRSLVEEDLLVAVR